MDKVELAYLAGLLEGECGFNIYRANRKDMLGPAYIPIIGLNMVEKDLVEWVASAFHAPINRRKNIGTGKKPQWKTYLGARRARTLLPRLLPFMRSARIRRRVELLLQLLESRRRTGKRLTPDITKERECIWEEYRRT